MLITTSYTLQIVLIGTALLGLASGLSGTFAVLRKESLIGDGLAHAALPGVVLAFLLTGIKDIEILLLGALVSSVCAALCISITTKYTKIHFDAALATWLSAFFGLGMVLLTYVQGLNNAAQAGLSKFIFGQAATMVFRDVVASSIVAAVIIATVLLFWKELKLIAFDMEYAKTLHIPVEFIQFVYRTMLMLTIIIGIQSVGAILMSSLLIAPAVGARQWTNRLGIMSLLAALFGTASCMAGVYVSAIVPNMPTGPALIVVLSIIVLISLLIAPNRGILWRLYKRYTEKYEL